MKLGQGTRHCCPTGRDNLAGRWRSDESCTRHRGWTPPPSSYLVPADGQVPAFHPPLLEVGGPAGSAPQAAVGEDLAPAAGAVDDQQHDQGKEDPQGGGALALRVGDSVSCCPSPHGCPHPAPLLVASPAGCPASPRRCLLSPGRWPSTHRAATHVSAPASARSSRQGPASTCKACGHPLTTALCSRPHAAWDTVPRCQQGYGMSRQAAWLRCAGALVGWVPNQTPMSPPFKGRTNPPAPVQGREMPWIEAGQALRCQRAKPDRSSCRGDPGSRTGSRQGLSLAGGAKAAQTRGVREGKPAARTVKSH